MTVRSPLLSKVPGIAHGFGTVQEPFPSELKSAWEESKVDWKQVHGKRCVEVAGPSQSCGETDGLWTAQLGLPIAVVTADCVPILMARRDGGLIAAVHAGWRGTEAMIAAEIVNQLKTRGETPSQWIATIGPSIGPCCYEVSEELAREFGRKFGPSAVPRHRYLDLPEVNRLQLLRAGLGETEVLRACTRCSLVSESEFRFHSYRREGGGKRQYSVIARTGLGT